MQKIKSEHNIIYDVVIVGSGPAGIHSAYPLIKSGVKTAIIDAGLNNNMRDEKLIGSLQTTFNQKSNAFDLIKKASHVFNKTYSLLRIKSNIEIIQSLAKGGLSEHWHGICDFFSSEELNQVGIPPNEIEKEYAEIAKLINLKLDKKLDFQSRSLLESVNSAKKSEIILYQAPLAKSYKTRLMLEKFKKFKNFTYISNQLVYKVSSNNKFAKLKCLSINKKKELLINSKYVILAAGSINTTRILLRSLNLYNYKTTFLTKAHFLTACLYPKMLKNYKNIKNEQSTQLVISKQKNNNPLDSFFIQLYKFNPLVIRKAAKYTPLPQFMALPLLSFFAKSLMIADIRFSSTESSEKYCKLIKTSSGDDVLHINFKETSKELSLHENEYLKIKKELNSLGLIPLKTTHDYTTSHYAGGVPFSKKPKKISADINGKLHGSKKIYIADASTWRTLPSKAPTLTIMANASRVGKKVLDKLRKKNDNILSV